MGMGSILESATDIYLNIGQHLLQRIFKIEGWG
jgi:hypothetical protein